MYRNKEELVRSAGYPYEKHSVVTSDGYTLTLERIPRHGATRCVYLQHGVLDNSFAWIATGATSLAFRAYDGGADVWMGNFRGAADEKHSNPSISPRQYWDFSLNEHAFCDIPAFVSGILTIKASELRMSRLVFAFVLTSLLSGHANRSDCNLSQCKFQKTFFSVSAP
jgi:hypothetical protein